MANKLGTYITEINGVRYYTDRVVKGDLTFSARVGLIEVSTTYDVYSGNWTDGGALKAPLGSFSVGIDNQGNLIGEAGYRFGQIAIVRTPAGEYSVVGGVGFDAGLLGGIQMSTTLGGSSYGNNLSTYNSARVNENGTISVTKFVSTSGGVFAVISTYSQDGALIGVPDRVEVAPDSAAQMSAGLAQHLWEQYCFPASTPIQTSLTATIPISDLRVGDIVLAFDPYTDNGRGALVPRRVTKLFSNVTTEWVKLSWTEAGVARELVATPGHHFLDQFGNFPPIAEMIRDGGATVVLASGELAEVVATRIVYSEATAHLFEQAQAHIAVSGNAALKPQMLEGWQTYNVEVEDLHTYVACGVRVHNVSLFAPETGIGQLGDNIGSQISDFAFGAHTLTGALAGSAVRSLMSTR